MLGEFNVGSVNLMSARRIECRLGELFIEYETFPAAEGLCFEV
jgi:hypothetical protein